MTPALFAGWLAMVGVVDQVDEGIAAIELPDCQMSYVPVAWLPDGVGEGDAVWIRVRRTDPHNRGQVARSPRRKHEHDP
jgi:hypothetical protein